jgi:hypothetical protein
VEGNGKPDVDIVQRQRRQGLGETRFGPLLAFHLTQRLAGNPLNGQLFADIYPDKLGAQASILPIPPAIMQACQK